MTLWIYSLSFIPIIIIALTVHELGHLLTARFHRVKTSGFQVGIGPTLLRRYTGRTVCSINAATVQLNQRTPPPRQGDIISVYVEPATAPTPSITPVQLSLVETRYPCPGRNGLKSGDSMNPTCRLPAKSPGSLRTGFSWPTWPGS